MSRSRRIPRSVKCESWGNMVSSVPGGFTHAAHQLCLSQQADQFSGFAGNLGPPPAHAHKQESPVVEELRWLTLKSVTDELKQPSKNEERESYPPEAVTDEAGSKQGERNQDGWNAVRVTNAVNRMLMASFVLRDPLLIGLSTQHAADDDTRGDNRLTWHTGIGKQLFRQLGLLQFRDGIRYGYFPFLSCPTCLSLPGRQWKKPP